jgi:4-amino-4-deoxy-L-arabinose transferase-like glycosyltransferase
MTATVEKFRTWLNTITPVQWLLVMIVFSSLLFFAGLDERQLWGADEPRIAGIATETAIKGNWIEPRLNGSPFLETPPLFLWLESISIKTFGRIPFAVKLPAAIAGMVGVIGIFLLTRRMGYSNFTALLAGILLATSARYWNNSRKCMTDILLCGFIILVMLSFYCFADSRTWRQRNWWFLFFAIALGGAILTKSLVGLAIPCAALACWLVLDDMIIKKKISWINWLGLFIGAMLSFIPFCLWLLALYNSSGYNAVYTVVWTNNFGRFLGSHSEHVEPFYYYLLKFPEQFQPWTIFLLVALCFYFNKFKQTLKNSQLLFILCWLIVPFLLLTFSAGKRQVYLLPLFGAMALLAAIFLAPIIEGKVILPAKYRIELIIRIITSLLATLVTLSPFLLLIVAFILKVPINSCLSLIFCLFASAGLIVFGFWIKKGRHPGIIAIGILFGVAVTYVAIDSVILKTFNHKNSTADIFSVAAKYLRDGDVVYLLSPTERIEGAAVFYLGTTVPELNSSTLETLRLSKDGAKAVILADTDSVKIDKNMVTVYEHKVKKDELVLLKFRM